MKGDIGKTSITRLSASDVHNRRNWCGAWFQPCQPLKPLCFYTTGNLEELNKVLILALRYVELEQGAFFITNYVATTTLTATDENTTTTNPSITGIVATAIPSITSTFIYQHNDHHYNNIYSNWQTATTTDPPATGITIPTTATPTTTQSLKLSNYSIEQP